MPLGPAGKFLYEAEVRRQAEVVARIATTIDDLATGLRPLVVKVTVAFWISVAALVVSVIVTHPGDSWMTGFGVGTQQNRGR